jgi:hypothetical protein
MTAASEIISGVGARYGVVFVLDSNGLPAQAAASATPETGVRIEGIKTLAANTPEPQRFTHYGDDSPFAQDSLPPTEVESFNITTAKVNLALDAYLEGAKVRTITPLQMRVGDSDQRGNEPLVMAAFYRQALDTDQTSTSFGRLRQWNWRIYPATRISPQAPSMEQGITDSSYVATPTKVSQTPWQEDFDTTNWGVSRGAHIEGVANYQPRFTVYVGDGTITSWDLTHAPYSSADILVWVAGSLTVPGSITYGTSPAFTVTPAVGVGTQIFAVSMTNTPAQADN